MVRAADLNALLGIEGGMTHGRVIPYVLYPNGTHFHLFIHYRILLHTCGAPSSHSRFYQEDGPVYSCRRSFANSSYRDLAPYTVLNYVYQQRRSRFITSFSAYPRIAISPIVSGVVVENGVRVRDATVIIVSADQEGLPLPSTAKVFSADDKQVQKRWLYSYRNCGYPDWQIASSVRAHLRY